MTIPTVREYLLESAESVPSVVMFSCTPLLIDVQVIVVMLLRAVQPFPKVAPVNSSRLDCCRPETINVSVVLEYTVVEV